MSQEKVLCTLESLGFAKLDAQVYLLLGKKGPQKAKTIGKLLNIPKTRLYVILRSLQSKGLVNATLEYPAKFSALPFEKALDLFVKAKMEDAQRIEKGKTEILNDWKAIVVSEVRSPAPRFTVIEGKHYIYPKLRQMIEETEEKLLIIASIRDLIRVDKYGLLDQPFRQSSGSTVQFRLLTDLNSQNLVLTKNLLKKESKGRLRFETRTPSLGIGLPSRMVIKDNKEALFFTNSESNDAPTEATQVCLWTDCKPLVDSFIVIFEDLWYKSTDLGKKIEEMDSQKTSQQNNLITDSEEAKKQYYKTLKSTKSELVVMTSELGLASWMEKVDLLKVFAKKGVSIKLMAPITAKNSKVAEELSALGQVKHVPSSTLETVLVDDHYLFQFRAPSSGQGHQNGSAFNQTHYTAELETVKKTKDMLYDVWVKAYAPFANMRRTVSEPLTLPLDDKRARAYEKTFQFIDKPRVLGKISEKEIITKILQAKKQKVRDWRTEAIIHYGSIAQAFIHPPANLNLPEMMIQICHNNPQSSFGSANIMNIFILAKTSKSPSFELSAVVYDSSHGHSFRKAMLEDSSAVPNILKAGEFEVRTQSNSFFAGWTRPIRLSGERVLPPAAILFEGYGEVRPNKATISAKYGRSWLHEGNGFEAFVTFFNPRSKYDGPGTEGVVFRDSILTFLPSSK